MLEGQFGPEGRAAVRTIHRLEFTPSYGAVVAQVSAASLSSEKSSPKPQGSFYGAIVCSLSGARFTLDGTLGTS